MPTEPIYRLSVDQYHGMIRSGILSTDDAVELLEGWLVYKMAKNPPHSRATRLLRKRLENLLPPDWFVDVQEPITTSTGEPEPDISVIKGSTEQFKDRHPVPSDVALIAEVADTTLQKDRGSKKRIYARENIPVYWIVNLVDNHIEVYTDPTGPVEIPDYRERRDYKPGEAVLVVIEGREVGRLAVSDLLPDPPRANHN